MPVEGRGLTSSVLSKAAKSRGVAMSLATPERIRSRQTKLNCTAKAKPAFRFYTLYDKICRADILAHAYEVARSNAGAPGVDGRTFEHIEVSGLQEWLAGLREDLVARTYRPMPVRRMMVPKPGGGDRPVRISTVRGGGGQNAAQALLGPVLPAELPAHA